MDWPSKKSYTSQSKPYVSNKSHSPFPDEVLEKILSFIDSNVDRSSLSLVCKDWYNAERWTRSKLFIGNCYAVSPQIVARRFPRIKSVRMKGKPRFSDFNLLPRDWGANVHSWVLMFVEMYPFLEELRLKRMIVSDETLELLANSCPNFKALSLSSCDGFTSKGLNAIATNCRNLTEFDIKDSVTVEVDGDWLSCFPENFTTLEVLNFSSLYSEVSFEALERLVARCKSLRVLKVNESIALDQLQRLLMLCPQLTELGTGTFVHELTLSQISDLETAFRNCKNLQVLSGMWDAFSLYVPVVYGVCGGLTFLNMRDATIRGTDFVMLISRCPNLRRLWVTDSIEDKGLESVGSSCPLLEELRVFPADPYGVANLQGVTESGFLAVSRGCPKLHYVLYFCRRMTNAAVITIARNCPNFTHFRLCIMNPGQPDYLTHDPMDEAFGAVVRTCHNLERLSVSGLLTDLTFEYIGKYAKNLETLSVAFAGRSDRAMECVLRGCPKLRKLEVRDCPFGNDALLSGIEKYEKMKSLWMSACNVTVKGCRTLAKEMPRLNVEVIRDEDEGGDELQQADKVYVYRTVAGPRSDAPPSVLTL